MEAKKQGVDEEELSMEEILQSIRRIIADDDEEKAKTVQADGKPAAGVSPVADSDILELTDMIEDDGSITNLKEGEKKEDVKAGDVLNDIDAALKQPDTTPEVKEEPKPEVKEEIKEEVKEEIKEEPKPEAKKIDEKPKLKPDSADALLSKNAEDAALSSLSKLSVSSDLSDEHIASPEFRSGTTVEDLVADMLRPMMKKWLDENLPKIVERIVEREVTRLTRR